MSDERRGLIARIPTWMWLVGVGALLVWLGYRAAKQRRDEFDDYLT